MFAYLDDQFVPIAAASIPIWDYGFTMGVTVTEQMRTFGGQIHLLDRHLQRLENGLAIIGVKPKQSLLTIADIAKQVVQRSEEEQLRLKSLSPAKRQLPSQRPAGDAINQDWGVGLCVTPGTQTSRAAEAFLSSDRYSGQPTLLVYAMPLAVQNWASSYLAGIKLSTVETREIAAESVPRELKSRSRVHYYLAEQEALAKHPQSRALLLDQRGFVAEGTTASVVMVHNGRIIAPHERSVLPSVSFGFIADVLAPELGFAIERRDIRVEELFDADEMLWLSSTSCVLPIAELDGRLIGDPKQRPVFDQLVAAWSQHVGVDLLAQAAAANPEA